MVKLHEGEGQTKATTIQDLFKALNAEKGQPGRFAVECPAADDLKGRRDAVTRLLGIWGESLKTLEAGDGKLFKPGACYPVPGVSDTHFDKTDLFHATGALSQIARPDDSQFDPALTDCDTGLVKISGVLYDSVFKTARPRDVFNIAAKMARPDDKTGRPLCAIKDYDGERKPILKSRVNGLEEVTQQAQNNALKEHLNSIFTKAGKPELIPAVVSGVTRAMEILQIKVGRVPTQTLNRILTILAKSQAKINEKAYSVDFVADEVSTLVMSLTGGKFKELPALNEAVNALARELEVTS